MFYYRYFLYFNAGILGQTLNEVYSLTGKNLWVNNFDFGWVTHILHVFITFLYAWFFFPIWYYMIIIMQQGKTKIFNRFAMKNNCGLRLWDATLFSLSYLLLLIPLHSIYSCWFCQTSPYSDCLQWESNFSSSTTQSLPCACAFAALHACAIA